MKIYKIVEKRKLRLKMNQSNLMEFEKQVEDVKYFPHEPTE
jgi:hypothetical protein